MYLKTDAKSASFVVLPGKPSTPAAQVGTSALLPFQEHGSGVGAGALGGTRALGAGLSPSQSHNTDN